MIRPNSPFQCQTRHLIVNAELHESGGEQDREMGAFDQCGSSLPFPHSRPYFLGEMMTRNLLDEPFGLVLTASPFPRLLSSWGRSLNYSGQVGTGSAEFGFLPDLLRFRHGGDSGGTLFLLDYLIQRPLASGFVALRGVRH